MTSLNKEQALLILERLAAVIEPKKGQHPILDQEYGEVMWLRQELAAGRLELPIPSTRDLSFPRLMSGGELEQWPDIDEGFKKLYDLLFEDGVLE